jgi:peptidyl-prolyl cis-trans isomerase B (cyclophilin B)
LVYQDTTLGPNYSIWGKITKGLQIVQSVASQGVNGGGSDGAPAQSVTIESVAVTIG